MKNVGVAKHSNHPHTPTERNAVPHTLIVGTNTKKFLNCLLLHDKLYSAVYSAFECLYGNSAEDMLKEYHKKSYELKEVILAFMCVSIEENLFENNLKKI